MAAQVDHCSANRSRPKVLQPPGAARYPDLCQLVRRNSQIRRRSSVSEQNERTDLRSPGRNVVVTMPMITNSEPLPVVTASPSYTRPLAVLTSLFFMWGFLTCLND